MFQKDAMPLMEDEGTSEVANCGWEVEEEGWVDEVERGIAGEKRGIDGGWMGGDRELRRRSRLVADTSDRPSEKSCGFCETCDQTSRTEDAHDASPLDRSEVEGSSEDEECL